MKLVVLLAVSSLCLIGLTQEMAQACECQPPIFPETGYEQAGAVFRGWVSDISPSSDGYVLDITISVSGYWKGSVTMFTHVYTSTYGGSCGYEGFRLCEEYLIYTEDSILPCCPGLLVTVCNRTRPIIKAGTDLDYLGVAKPVPAEEMTWGEVKQLYRD
jgi:hypothetical protein